MNRLVASALKYRTVTLLAVAMLFGAGLTGAAGLQQELFPAIQPPFLIVTAIDPGTAPASIVDTLAEPVENVVESLSGLDKVSSSSSEGVMIVFAEFTFGTDVEERRRQIEDGIAQADLPDGVETSVQSLTPDDLPIYSVAFSGDVDTIAAAVRDGVLPRLERIPGIADVSMKGADEPQVLVELDPDKLERRGLTAPAVVQALTSQGLSAPLGTIADNDTTLPIRVSDPLTSVADVEDILIPLPGAQPAVGGPPGVAPNPGAPDAATAAPAPSGATSQAAPGTPVPSDAPSEAVPPTAAPSDPAAEPVPPDAASIPVPAAASAAPAAVRLHTLGSVRLDSSPDATTIARIDGIPAVSLEILKEQGANTVAVIDDIEAVLADAELPSGTEVTTIVNQGPEISQGVTDVTRDALLGALLAVVVIIIFLRSWRGTIVASIAIPLSLIIALGAMRLADITLNILTLGALAVASGRVVDDAIVVLENTYRNLELGHNRFAAVRIGASEVTGAVTSATLTAVAVFAPLAFIGGLAGEIFVGFALTTTFALLASLVVATTVVPVLGSFLLRRAEADKADPENSPLRRMVGAPLGWALRHRWLTVALALVALVGSLTTLSSVPLNLFPGGEAETIVVSVDAPAQWSVARTDARVGALEERVAQVDGVETITTSLGRSLNAVSLAFGSGGGGDATLTVTPADGADVAAMRDDLEQQLVAEDLEGSVVEQSAIPGSGDLVVEIQGGNLTDLESVANDVQRQLQDNPALANLTTNLAATRPELVVDLKEKQAATLGLDAQMLAQALRASINPVPTTTATVDGDERDVVVQLESAARDSAGDVRRLPLAGGLTVGDVADVRRDSSPVAITRTDGERSAEVRATIIDPNVNAVFVEVEQVLGDLDLPPGVTVAQTGGTEQLNETFSSMFVAMALAVALVYLILVATLGSLQLPVIIMLSLPLATIGAFPALAATGRELGLPAMIGFLMLIGIVITNAIVLLEFIQQRRREGMSTTEAVLDAAQTRIRPILMTALTTMAGLVPLALGLSEGALLSASLATVVIGGLLSSTLLTVIVIPVVYSLTDRWRRPPASRATAEEATDETDLAPAHA